MKCFNVHFVVDCISYSFYICFFILYLKRELSTNYWKWCLVVNVKWHLLLSLTDTMTGYILWNVEVLMTEADFILFLHEDFVTFLYPLFVFVSPAARFKFKYVHLYPVTHWPCSLLHNSTFLFRRRREECTHRALPLCGNNTYCKHYMSCK